MLYKTFRQHGRRQRRLSELAAVATQPRLPAPAVALLDQAANSHCVFQRAPQIRPSKNETSKMQAVFCWLFEVEADRSSYCPYLDAIRGC